MQSIKSKIIWLTLFSIAMGYMETAVVVYLRELYYPNGFQFTLTIIPYKVAATEFWREAATIIMLAAVGIFTGKTKMQCFAFFVYCFAIWDIFYYVFLKIILDWPASLFTWDILFLIPVPWVGPVLTPCIISLTMIVFMLMIIYYSEKNISIKINRIEWWWFISGALIQIFSFIWDYVKYVHKMDRPFWTLSDQEALFSEIAEYVPQEYNWSLFVIGEAFVLFGIWKIYRRVTAKIIKL